MPLPEYVDSNDSFVRQLTDRSAMRLCEAFRLSWDQVRGPVAAVAADVLGTLAVEMQARQDQLLSVEQVYILVEKFAAEVPRSGVDYPASEG